MTGKEPVTLAEAKVQCSVDGPDHDVHIGRLIRTARELIEGRTGLLLRAQTLEIEFDRFVDWFQLPRAPISEISSLTYGEDATAITNFSFVTRLGIPTLRPVVGARWPSSVGPVTLQAAGGFALAEVPEMMRHAILLQVEDWYDHGAATDAISPAIDRLVSPHRLSWL